MKRSKALVSIVTLATVLMFCSTANAFENDPDVLGDWESVDFVVSISDFKPGEKSWKGDLYLEEFEFKKEGSTHKPYWTWTKGHVYHAGDKSDAKYIIKKIDGEEYLFLEWMSGDVINRDKTPMYYVLKRK